MFRDVMIAQRMNDDKKQYQQLVGLGETRHQLFMRSVDDGIPSFFRGQGTQLFNKLDIIK